MAYFESYILRQQHQKAAALGDAGELANWLPIRKIVSGICDNTSPKGGRPNTGPIVIIKLMPPQARYRLDARELGQ